MLNEIYQIKGMTCAACSRRIEMRLAKVEGVNSATVNLATDKLHISYDNKIVSQERIEELVQKLGFTATKWQAKEEQDLHIDNTSEKTQKIKLFLSLLLTLPLFYISMGQMDFIQNIIALPIPEYLNPKTNPINFALIQFKLAFPVMLIGYKFYTGGIKAIYHRSPNMDSLIAVGTLAAFIYSLYALYMLYMGDIHYLHQLYFESVGMIITLILLGKYFEALARKRTGNAIRALMDLTPKMATKIENEQEIQIPLSEVKKDDILLVKAGDSIPCDSLVLKGESYVDESMLTGESKPVYKNVNATVIGGTLNKNGTLTIQAQRLGKESTLAQLITFIEEAQAKRPQIAKLADTVSGIFVQSVFVIAVLTTFLWYLNGAQANFLLQIFTAVLLIACPCALGLATPTALMVGIGRGAEMGILIRGASALEIAARANTLVFDKTGTITEGRFRVQEFVLNNEKESTLQKNEILEIAAALEKYSEHPIAEAVLLSYTEASEGNINPLESKVENFKVYSGLGIEASINNSIYYIGNQKFIEQSIAKEIPAILIKEAEVQASQGHSLLYISTAQETLALFTVADTLKEGTAQTIEKLHSMNIECIMLTGDNKQVAQSIAAQIGIKKIYAEALPQDKLEVIKNLQAEGKTVVMVGDGINDAPALALAHVGIAMHNGTDVAINSADMVLMQHNLELVTKALALSKATITNIKQNLFWAFCYNILCIPAAAGVLYIFNGPLLNPAFAALAMTFSSLSVVLNALRLKKVRI